MGLAVVDRCPRIYPKTPARGRRAAGVTAVRAIVRLENLCRRLAELRNCPVETIVPGESAEAIEPGPSFRDRRSGRPPHPQAPTQQALTDGLARPIEGGAIWHPGGYIPAPTRATENRPLDPLTGPLRSRIPKTTPHPRPELRARKGKGNPTAVPSATAPKVVGADGAGSRLAPGRRRPPLRLRPRGRPPECATSTSRLINRSKSRAR